MRLFVAIDLPQSIRELLAAEQARFRKAAADARWTRPQGIHLTLKFLGEVPENQVAGIKRALWALGAFEPFQVRVKGFGFFPQALRPHVFWAGIDSTSHLNDLAARVEAALAPLGFPPEKRAFNPHLTLVRFKIPRRQPKLQELAAEKRDAILGEFAVTEFFLWESKLGPQGAQYTQLARFP